MSVITPGVELYLGNTRWLNFRLRRFGQRAAYGVSSAQKIAVEFAREGEAPLPPVLALRDSPGADWVGGVVPVLVSPADLTARVGTYRVTVTVFDPPTVSTASQGTVEVLPRPVIESLLLPAGAGGVYTASQVFAGTSASASVIRAGTPVHRTGAGVIPAQASGAYTLAVGVAIADTAPGLTVLYVSDGSLRLPDWTAVFGASSLPLHSPVYLGDAPGVLTSVYPDLPGSAVRQVVGTSDNDPLTLNVDPDTGVVL